MNAAQVVALPVQPSWTGTVAIAYNIDGMAIAVCEEILTALQVPPLT